MLCTPIVSEHLRTCIAHKSGFRERVAELHDLLSYRIASGTELEMVQAMRYKAYLAEGAAAARIDKRLDDVFDLSTNGATIILGFGDHICASIRLHIVTSAGQDSPAVHAFPDELVPLIKADERLIDPNCFCVDPLLSGGMPELAYLTLRLPFMAAGLCVHSSVTATVRAEHAAFYRRVLRCEMIAKPREYAGRSKPLGLMLVSYDREAGNVLARYPFFAPSSGEAERIGLDRIGIDAPAHERVAA